MRVKLPVAGAAFVGAFAVISYILNSQPATDIGVVAGLLVVTAIVIVAVVLIGRYSQRFRSGA